MFHSVLGGLVLCSESSPQALSAAMHKTYSIEKPQCQTVWYSCTESCCCSKEHEVVRVQFAECKVELLAGPRASRGHFNSSRSSPIGLYIHLTGLYV